MLICKTIATGSSGNSYALMNDNEILLLDLGVSAKVIKKAIDFRISDVVGAIVSHVHSDHAKAVKDFENMGIKVWKPFSESNLTDRMKFGGFSVQCFPLPHNGVANFGFYINIDGQKILYLTDYEYCRFNFKSLQVNHIICECNYQQELVSRDLANYEHKIRGHSSLDYCKRFISDNKTNALRTVILCHMGAETTIEQECLAEAQKVVGEGVKCVCAEAGETVELSLYPF